MQRRVRRRQRKLTPEIAERCDRGQRPRWGVLFGCWRRLLRSITASLYISEAIDLPLLRLKDGEKLRDARWIQKKKHSQLLLSAVHKGTGRTLSSKRLFMSDYKKPGSDMITSCRRETGLQICRRGNLSFGG